jgi:hypothetical protein
MQKEMSNMDNNPSSKMCNKPNSSGEGMKKMQQSIKGQMKQMLKNKKEGKGNPSSKELAKLAAHGTYKRKTLSRAANCLIGFY